MNKETELMAAAIESIKDLRFLIKDCYNRIDKNEIELKLTKRLQYLEMDSEEIIKCYYEDLGSYLKSEDKEELYNYIESYLKEFEYYYNEIKEEYYKIISDFEDKKYGSYEEQVRAQYYSDKL